jgi:hypothetical protein
MREVGEKREEREDRRERLMRGRETSERMIPFPSTARLEKTKIRSESFPFYLKELRRQLLWHNDLIEFEERSERAQGFQLQKNNKTNKKDLKRNLILFLILQFDSYIPRSNPTDQDL